MSTQSINLNYKKKHIEEATEILIYNFEQYFYEKYFKLGGGADIHEMTYYRHLKKILCIDDCEIVNYIQDKLDGNLGEQKQNKVRKSFSQSLYNYNNSLNTNSKNFWNLKQW